MKNEPDCCMKKKKPNKSGSGNSRAIREYLARVKSDREKAFAEILGRHNAT